MTTYKELFGKYVQNYASDPTSTDAEGQIWYNTTSGTFKTALGSYGAWAAGGNLNTARNTRGAGTQTATIAMGGNPQNVTESYNGTSWTTLPATMATARNQIAAVGTQTSALAIGGYDGARLANTEVWNGTSYSSGGALGTGVSDMGGSGNGTATAALVFGGAATPGQTNITQSYNGSAWTTVPATLSAPNATMGGLGVQTAALVFGGQNPGYTTATQSYNGTSWTTVNSLNTARGENIGGAGSQTAGLAFGGSPPNTGLTESWNGTSWTARSTMATGRYNIGGSGTQTSALAFGGATPSLSALTEEWTQSVSVPVAGSWSSGGNLGTARSGIMGFGIQTAAIGGGGYLTPTTAATESYNGTSWTTVNSMGTARYNGGATGVQTAGIAIAGWAYPSPPSAQVSVESWNGTSWTALTNLPVRKNRNTASGTQTAALTYGGEGPNDAPINTTYAWNGSSWTTGGNLNTARASLGGGGTQTAAIAAAGYVAPVYTPSNATELYNGTSWTSVNSMNTGRFFGSFFGTQSLATYGGGTTNPGPTVATTENWNGTTWSTNPNSMATARQSGIGSAGTQTAGLSFGGASPFSNSTEEYTGPYTTLNYKTLTTS